MKIDEVNFQQVGNIAFTQLVGSCHDKNQSKLETVLSLNSWASARIKNQNEFETMLPLNSWPSAMIANQSK